MTETTGPTPSRQGELPLTEGTLEHGPEDEVEKKTGSRYERRTHPPKFEFGDAASSDGQARDPEERSDPQGEGGSPAETPPPRVAGDSTEELGLDTLFERAKGASRSGRLEEATRLYRQVVALDPTNVRARNNLAVLLDQTGEHAVALEHFQAAMELQPENSEIMANLGAALASQGRYEEAEAQLRKAARLDPGGLDVRVNLGILYFRRGLYAQADHELRWVCENDPDHALAHIYRGEALNRLGRVDEALAVLEHASHLQPDRARIYYLLGILYDKKNLKGEAALMYRKARELADR